MRRSNVTIDWKHVLCPQCGETFDYALAARVWEPGMQGVRRAVCSSACAKAFTEEHATDPDTLFEEGR